MKKRTGKQRKKWTGLPWEQLPGILLLAVLPLIGRMKVVDTGLSKYPWFSSEAIQGDFFLYWKSRVFFLLAFCMLVLTVLHWKRLRLKKSWLFLFGYLALAVVSALCSEYGTVSFLGLFGSWQGVPVLICCGITAVYFSWTADSEKSRCRYLWALAAGAGIQGFLGLGQLLGFDFWSTGVGQRILAPAGTGMRFRFADSARNRVYMASYNPNYAAVYCILLLPVVAVLMCRSEKRWQKAVTGAVGLLLVVSLWGTGSRAGLLAAGILAAAGVLCAFTGWKKRCLGVLGMAALAAVFLLCGSLTGMDTVSGLKKELSLEKREYDLKEVRADEKGVRILYQNEKLLLNLEEGADGSVWMRAEDGSGELQQIEEDAQTGRYLIPPIEKLQFEVIRYNEELCLVMYQNEIPWYFVKDGQTGAYSYLTLYGKPDTIEKAPYLFFEGRERLFTNRGYIWSRTFPLLRDTVLVGTGPDTFALEFPQNDYVMRANLGKKLLGEAITRPHSMYLQTGVETGLVSLALLLLFLLRMLWGLAGSRTEERTWKLGICLSVAGYLVMGITNDSVLAVAPVFYAVVGMGMSRIAIKQNN